MSTRIKELEREIEHHNYLYHVEDKPIITDAEYDMLLSELRELDPNHRLLTSIGGAPKGTFRKVKHTAPMLSLSKATLLEEVEKWLGTYDELLLQPKMDGLSLALRYKDGKLIQAITRGNGTEGDDVTAQAKMINDIPQKLAQKISIEVRGEVFMKHSIFKKLQKKGIEGANCRNMAAGSLRQKDASITKERELSFVAHDVVGEKFEAELNKMTLIQSLGISSVPYSLVHKNELKAKFKLWEKQREVLDFDIDGIVLKLNDYKLQEKLGADHHSPKWAIAWKFKAEEGSSILREVEWNIGREGCLTGVAIFDPVQCAGATITRASLHSADAIERLGINIGDKIIISRRGDVIPHVEGVLQKNNKGTLEFPKTCPSCESNLIRDGAFLFCKNPECKSQQVRAFDHWKQETGMDFLGKKSIRRFVKEGLLKDVADLYTLKDKKEQLLALDRAGERSVEKVISTIEAKRELDLGVFLAALGIESLGTRIGIKLANKFKTLKRVREATITEIDEMEGFGDLVSKDIVEGLKSKSELIDKLLSVGVKVKEAKEVKVTANSLQDKHFCVTGKLEHFSREGIEEKIQEYGGVVAGVNNKLDYLITNTPDSGTGKNKKADELGIKKITEEEFLKMVGE